MNVVPTKRTSHSEADFAKALVSAYRATFGAEPSKQTAELLHAHMWIETGVGVSIMNENPGNMSASAAYAGNVWRPNWFNVPGPDASARTKFLHAEMLKKRAPSAFRAYSSLSEGMADHFAQLRRSFPSLLSAAQSGDLQAYADAVSGSGYCRDEACQSHRIIVSLRTFRDRFAAKGLYQLLVPLVVPGNPGKAECPDS